MNVQKIGKVALVVLVGAAMVLPVEGTDPGSLIVNDLEVNGDVAVDGQITSITKDRKVHVLSSGDGWYRIVDAPNGGETGYSHNGKIHVYGSLGNNRITDLTMYVGGAGMPALGSTIHFVHEAFYNGTHVLNVRVGRTAGDKFCVDLNLWDIEDDVDLIVETYAADTLPLLDVVIFNPTAPTANVLELAPCWSLGGGSDAYHIAFGLGSKNVGVGTNNPAEKLEVLGNVRVTGDIDVLGGDITVDGDKVLVSDGSVAMTDNLTLNGNYLSGDGDDEGVYVAADGTVGIGTASPASAYALDVNGYVQATMLNLYGGGVANKSKIGLLAGPGYSQPFCLDNYQERFRIWGSAEYFTIRKTGKVGIGAGNPSTKLHVKDATDDTKVRVETTAADKDAGIDLVTASETWTIYNDESDSNKLKFDNGSASVTVDSSGNVGIGTTSPDDKLDITYAAGVKINSFRGTTDTDITGWVLYNADGEACYLYPNADQNGLVVSSSIP